LNARGATAGTKRWGPRKIDRHVYPVPNIEDGLFIIGRNNMPSPR